MFYSFSLSKKQKLLTRSPGTLEKITANVEIKETGCTQTITCIPPIITPSDALNEVTFRAEFFLGNGYAYANQKPAVFTFNCTDGKWFMGKYGQMTNFYTCESKI